MKVGPTVDGRIKLMIDDKGDFHLLAEMINDASHDGDTETLANQVGRNICDQDWEDFIKPDLIKKFNTDILSVAEQIKSAQTNSPEEIFISPENKSQWYSTLNQARLNLELEYKISEVDEEELSESRTHPLLEPCIKSNFYLQLQSLILDYFDF